MDLKLGGRMLVKYPGLTVVGGVAMAFAIWVGLVVFQVVSLLTNPTLPLSQAARLVEIRGIDVAVNDEEQKILHDFLEWQQSLQSVTDVGAWRDSSRNLVVAAGDARPVNVAEMSVSGFRVADGEPLMGRVLVEADEHPAAPAVAVIGYDVWRTRFGGDPNVLGRDVQLGNESFTVVGIMREAFEFPVSHDVWLPLKTAVLDQEPRSGPTISVFALLAPGETMQTAQAELTTAGRRAATEWPATHQHLEPRVRPYAMMMLIDGPGDTAIMYSIYFVAAVLLSLICGNIGLLLFARAADPMTLAPQMRDVAMAVDPSLRLVGVQRVNEANSDLQWLMALWMRITVVLSSVAIVLSLAGIYAVLSFTVARRTREIGLRVALGASRRRVVAATFRRPLLQVAGGIVVGTAIVFTLASLIKYTEFPGSESDLTAQGMAMIIGYGIVMLGVCMLACVVPTRRALNIEPTIALRTE